MKKKIFYILLGITFLMLFAYNILTPYLSDDIFYAAQVREAHSLWDLIKQQYGEYLSNSGRIIGQFNIRLSLVGDKMIFNVINSCMFVILSLLIYVNIPRRKKYDIFLYLLIVCMLWKYTVDFGQTMLWICGACNYLWGSVIILGFITFYRFQLNNYEKIKKPVLLTIGTGLGGVAAGWCNENTSGGGLLLLLIFSLIFYLEHRKIYGFMISGPVGMLCGIIGMISAPGVASRSGAMEENYTGMIGLLSRIYKITLDIRELFWPLLVIFIIVTVLLILQKKIISFYKSESIIFMFVGIATAYALMLAPTPANRAFFGAGVFMIIACIQGIMELKEEEMLIRAAKYSFVTILSLWLIFTYLDNLVNLARIYREENERIELILETKAVGGEFAVVPQYREAFRNPYSVAHDSDMTENPRYWINTFYEGYYEIGSVVAIPREEWNELHGLD